MTEQPQVTQVPEVKISDLYPYQNRFKVTFKVIDKSEVKDVNNRDNPQESHKLSNITVADDSGSIILTAWDNDIDFLTLGKFFSLTNGYVNLFRTSMRLARGRFGQFEEVNMQFDVNLSKNRSEEEHQHRPRRRRNFRRINTNHEESDEDNNY